MALTVNTPVTLKAKGEKGKERTFDIKQANSLLKLHNTQWELNDAAYEHNGTELVKKSGKTKESAGENEESPKK